MEKYENILSFYKEYIKLEQIKQRKTFENSILEEFFDYINSKYY